MTPEELAEELKERGFDPMQAAQATLILWREMVGNSSSKGFAYYRGPMRSALDPTKMSKSTQMMCNYTPGVG